MIFKIIGTEQCTYCKRAEMVLSLRGYKYEKKTLVTEEEIEAFRTQGYRTVPQIWYSVDPGRGFFHIGGFNELMQFLDRREKEETQTL